MARQQTAEVLIPPRAPLAELARIAAGCTACALHETGTQTVFGEGAPDAELVLVGEQPGDLEDQEGRPFVGPAGRELDRGLEAVGLDAVTQYRTNAVKHFKWAERRGKRRIHEKPNRVEITACLPWLQAELARTRPRALVLLGATAAQAVLGPKAKVTRARGRLHLGPHGLPTVPTLHPSSVLRSRSDRDRIAARQSFQDDLAAVATLLHDGPAGLAASATVAELRELAVQLGIDLPARSRKADLVAAVAAQFEARAA